MKFDASKLDKSSYIESDSHRKHSRWSARRRLGGNKNLLGRIIVYISLLSRHHAKIDPMDKFRSATKIDEPRDFSSGSRLYLFLVAREQKRNEREIERERKKRARTIATNWFVYEKSWTCRKFSTPSLVVHVY